MNERVYTSLQPSLNKLEKRLEEKLDLMYEKKFKPKWRWLETPIEKASLLGACMHDEDAERIATGLAYYINALGRELNSLTA